MSSYFAPEEFACRCGRLRVVQNSGSPLYPQGEPCDAPEAIDPELLRRLNILRAIVNRPIHITSGLRCRWWNDRTPGSSPDSEHLFGWAVDLSTKTARERDELLDATYAARLFTRREIGPAHLHVGIGDLRRPTDYTPRVAWLP